MAEMLEFSFPDENYFMSDDVINISIFSDCVYPLFITIPKGAIVNKISITTDYEKKIFNYTLKNTKTIKSLGNSYELISQKNNGDGNGNVESRKMSFPPEFKDKSKSEVSREISENIEVNMKFLEKNYKHLLHSNSYGENTTARSRSYSLS